MSQVFAILATMQELLASLKQIELIKDIDVTSFAGDELQLRLHALGDVSDFRPGARQPPTGLNVPVARSPIRSSRRRCRPSRPGWYGTRASA